MWKAILSDPEVQAALLALVGGLSLWLVVLGTSLLSRLAGAAGVRLSKEQLELVRGLAQFGIRAAEEWAKATIRHGGAAPSGDAKTAHAVQAAKSLAPRPISQWPAERLAVAVQAELPAERLRMSLPPPSLPPAPMPPQR